MPKFRVCVVESREYIFEFEAADAAEAEDIAKYEDTDLSITDAFRESVVDWVEEI